MKKKKIYNLLLFILIFCSILSIIILKPIGNLDELWNYNFARNVADGLVPYKDFNMLQMPLLPLICGIALKVTFNELIVMRILAALLCSTIIYIIYKLFSILNIKKEVYIVFLFVIGCFFKDLFCIDYNFATLLLVLIIIFKEIKLYKKDDVFLKNDYKTDVMLGILAGLTLTLKQTTGIFICIVLLGNKLLFVRTKEELKIYLKTFIFRLIGIAFPVLLMLIYLIINNAAADFINYTIKGVSGFSYYISYKNLIKWNLVGFLSILVPITLIYAWIKYFIMEKDKKIYVLLVYGLAMFVICFPISDKIHLLIGALPTIMIILYELYNCLRKIFKKILKVEDVKFISAFLKTCIILFLLYFTIVNFCKYFIENGSYSQLNHFKFIPIDMNSEKQIEQVDKFILLEDKKVTIIDASAAIYMIPINKYNKDYDMLLKGNLGFNGENNMIEEISNSKDTKYLILNDKYNKNWQTPLNIIDYVKENKTKIGEIEIFDIYE